MISLLLVAAGRFERAPLVGIFVTQVFAFVASRCGAVLGLAVNLVLLWMLRAVQTRAASSRELVVH
ncbi:MAG TPA: hypothetical protein VNO82_25940 [Solirubrobacteraceae bacterium]|nr:hypothetical protein [Solirubrobacteraceae bacterium]